MNNNTEITYIEGMIVELNKAINNAEQFGDMVTVNAISTQLANYQNRLDQLKSDK